MIALDLLKQGGVYQWVSYSSITNSLNARFFQSRSRLAFLLIGVLLGLLTLYFI